MKVLNYETRRDEDGTWYRLHEGSHGIWQSSLEEIATEVMIRERVEVVEMRHVPYCPSQDATFDIYKILEHIMMHGLEVPDDPDDG